MKTVFIGRRKRYRLKQNLQKSRKRDGFRDMLNS